jgi:hypothetical protein
VLYGWAALIAVVTEMTQRAGSGVPDTAVGSPRAMDVQFPARYSGAFERGQRAAAARPGRAALNPEARNTLARRFGPGTAGDLISIVERMAAAAAESPDGTSRSR